MQYTGNEKNQYAFKKTAAMTSRIFNMENQIRVDLFDIIFNM